MILLLSTFYWTRQQARVLLHFLRTDALRREGGDESESESESDSDSDGGKEEALTAELPAVDQREDASEADDGSGGSTPKRVQADSGH